jgi:hypothetical protein
VLSQHERSPQIKSSNNCEFCENWGNESHALFKGVVIILGEIQYKRSAHNAVELMGVLSNLAQVRLYSSYRHK